MSFIATKSKFHVALDGEGLILQGAPDRAAYAQEQAPVYNQRFGEGDRSYNDLAAWWYLVQTSWAAGFKDISSWEDDAKYFYSTNIDAYSENGAFKLAKGLAVHNDFAEDIWFGSYETVGSSSYKYIGTQDGGASKPKLYRYSGSWADIISGYIPASADWVSDAMAHKGKLWVSTVGGSGASTFAVFKCDADGTNQVDYTAAIATAMGWGAVTGCHAMATDGNTLYVAVQQYGSSKFGIAQTIDSGANWTVVATSLNFTTADAITCLLVSGGNLTYLIERDQAYELRRYNIADAVDVSLQIFYSTFSSVLARSSASRRLLRSFQGKTIITIPSNEIWELDSNDVLRRLLRRDDFKNTTLAPIAGESSFEVSVANQAYWKGCVEFDQKLWWGNLMYDGTYFFNTKKGPNETSNKFATPLFADPTLMYWGNVEDDTILYVDSGYKSTADKNYLVFNNFDIISGVDKLAYSATLIFRPLTSGQSISVEYLTGELTAGASWTVLGTASYATDGGVVTDKTFYFGSTVTFKKLWIRIKMLSGGADTPTLTDYVMEYLPVPTFKKNWTININCGDEVKRLDGGLVATVGRELKGRLERSWWTKSLLDYQDLDYATTLLNGAISDVTATTITVDDTYDFPEQGRLRIDDEEITYTDKTPTTFTGCIRGARSTRAATHSDNAVINNAYKVLITNMSARAPIVLEDKALEYTLGISLREV